MFKNENNMSQNIFVKISGDLIDTEKVFRWISKCSKRGKIVICVGGGTQINNALAEAGIPFRKHGPLGREHQSEAEKTIAEKILAKNVKKMKSLCKKHSINCKIIAPIIEIGGTQCHINGDQIILAAYLGYDQLFVLTTAHRVKKKQNDFRQYPKIKVVGF
jgi:acetylglutamate kinase